jgi:aspartyl-tRNA(Asn)/glutamyl-tRNA(Gln) amidotransferase subunit C
MPLERAEVLKIAWLARLKLADADTPTYTEQLSGILDFVDQMNAVDTTAITPLAHPLDLHLRLREDTVSEPDERELFQSLAPRVQDGLYLVPQVIDT